MKDNGTDRDVALDMLDALSNCATIISTINTNLFHAVITTQPTSQEAALSETAEFTVVAVNAVSYRWQVQQSAGANWVNSTHGTGYETATFSVSATATRYTYSYRCAVTGKDGEVIYSDVVKILEPEAEG